MEKLKERTLDIVNPYRWERHITEDIENKYDPDLMSRYNPLKYVPTPLRLGVALGEALIKNNHKPSKVRVEHGLKKNSEPITTMPPRSKSKKTTKKKKKQKTKKVMNVIVQKTPAKKGRGKSTRIVSFGTKPNMGHVPYNTTPYISNISTNVGAGHEIRFLPSMKKGCVKIAASGRLGVLAWANNLCDPADAYSPANTLTGIQMRYFNAANTDAVDTLFPLNWSNPFYSPNPLEAVVRMFGKFKINRMTLTGKSAVGNQVFGQANIAYVKDPEYLESQMWFADPTGHNYQYSDKLLGRIPTCKTVSFKDDWVFNVPLEKRQDMLYALNNYTGTPYLPGALGNSATDRQTLQGLLLFNVVGTPETPLENTPPAPAGVTTGVVLWSVFYNVEIEMCDMGMQPTHTLPTATMTLSKQLAALGVETKFVRQERDNKEDLDLVEKLRTIKAEAVRKYLEEKHSGDKVSQLSFPLEKPVVNNIL